MARVGLQRYGECLVMPHVREMDYTGKPMKGMVFVDPEAIDDDGELGRWLGLCEEFVASLVPKPGN